MAYIVKIFTIDLILCVIFQKFALPLGGEESQIAMAFVIHVTCLGLLARKNLVYISPLAMTGYGLLVGITAILHIFCTFVGFSFGSLALFWVVSALYLFRVRLDWDAYKVLIGNFIAVGTAAACLVYFDWLTQFAHLGMFNLEIHMPEKIVYLHYNYVQPLHWGSPWMKPNAIFFLEASHISQFISLTIVAELCLFRRIKRLAFLFPALFLTYGGTGMLVLFGSLPFLINRLPARLVMAGVLVVPLALGGILASGAADSILKRTTEFDTRGSSGNIRFVRPAEAVRDAVAGNDVDLFFGKGAGAMPKGVSAGGASFAWAPYAKVFVEYGFIAFVVWVFFMGTAMFGRGVPFVISWAAFLQYNFMNGSLNVPLHTVYNIILAAGITIVAARPAATQPFPSLLAFKDILWQTRPSEPGPSRP